MDVLIVDDSSIIRRTIEMVVHSLGMRVVGQAGDGLTALALLDSFQPQIITLDITMPRMDGLECLREIMEANPAHRVLVISALRDPSTGLQALKTGAKGFLPKPFTKESLATELKRIAYE